MASKYIYHSASPFQWEECVLQIRTSLICVESAPTRVQLNIIKTLSANELIVI